MDKRISRRRFVAAASASAASVMIVPRHVLGGAGVQAPSDTLNIAGIGVGGRGRADVRGCGSENIAALCDADLGFAARTFREFPDARVYADYRQMLDREPDLDAVVIATPDHTHAVIAMEAMRRGARSPIRCVWRDGSLAPSRPPQLAAGERLPGGTSGQLFEGDGGVIGADMYGREPRVFPTALHEDVTASPPPKKYPRSAGVYREWIDACKGNGAAGSSFDTHAGPLTEVVLLGNLAVRSGAAIEWDAERMRVSNVPEANAFLDEEYREGWSL